MNMNRILRALLMVTLSTALAVGMWWISPVPGTMAQDTVYYSQGTGDFNALANWNSMRDGSGTAPSEFTGNTFAVQNGHVMTLSANVSIGTLTVETGGIVDAATFTLTISGTFTLQANSEFRQGGTVQAVPGATRDFATTSTYRFYGTQAGTANASYPEFGNLIWEPTPGGGGTFQNSNMTAPFYGGMVVRGDMTINIQGGTAREVRFATASAISRIHTIDGNLNITSGNSIAVVSNGTTTGTINIGENLNITAGIFRGVNSTGPAYVNIAGNISNNATWQHGAGSGVFIVRFNGSSTQTIEGNAINVDNFIVDAGATVVIPATNIPTVAGTLTNNGVLKQTQIVNNATVNFLTISTDKYRGVDIQTTNDLGAVTVAIQGNADACTDDPASPPYIKRCFSIEPTNNAAATLTLWATDGELNGIDNADLALYRFVAGWVKQLTNFSVGTGTNSYNYVTADVDGFSSFLIGDTNNAPTAVALSGLSATSPFAVLAVGLLAAAGLVVLRKRK